MNQKGGQAALFRTHRAISEMNSVHIKLKSDIGLGGVIHKAGTVVEVTDAVARDLLHRGKADPATADDADAEAEGDDAPKSRAKK